MTQILDADFDDLEMYAIDDDAEIDAFHAGYDMHRRGQPCPDHDRAMRDGWLDRQAAIQVRVVMPARPEGYYHMPIGSFD